MRRGKKVVFHGAFGTKAKAKKKERKLKGAYVRKVRMKGRGTRFLVLTRRKR
jgi:hypothetical protein